MEGYPYGIASSGVRQQTVAEDVLKKTRMCRFYSQGSCGRGEACAFAHGREQLQQRPNLFKTSLCRYFIARGTCRAGKWCKFAHCEGELRSTPPAVATESSADSVPATLDCLQLKQQVDALHRKLAMMEDELHSMQSVAAAASPARSTAPTESPLAFGDACSETTTEPSLAKFLYECGKSIGELERASDADSDDGTAVRVRNGSKEQSMWVLPTAVLVVKNTFIESVAAESGVRCRRPSSVPANLREQHEHPTA